MNRRRFLGQPAALLTPWSLRAWNAPRQEGPLLRAISSWKSSPDVNYFFAFDAAKFYANVDPEMKAVSQAGFNALYLIYHPYRSEDGRPTPWQDDIPLNDPDFAGVPPPGPGAGDAEARTFRSILAACRKHGLKTLFNVGCWSTQKWFREHPGAISKLPGDKPQYDQIFQRSYGKDIFTPCFRSREFLSYAETVVRAWLRQYHREKDFQAVLPRVRVTDRFEVRLDSGGVPLFFIHQDTIDRDWCHCSTCQATFRDYLKTRYGSIDQVNRELEVSYASLEEVTIPLSPHVPGRERFAATDPVRDPRKKRLWYEAARFWSEGITAWRGRIVGAVREFYPGGEVMMISKYPLGAFLTDYAMIAREGRFFLMDSYPMESGREWNLLRYFFDIEVYQSAAEQQGQALVAHLQAYDNRLPNKVTRAPSPEEYRQQQIGLIGRRTGAVVTFAFEHAVQLSPGGRPGSYVPDPMNVVRQWHRAVEPVEEAHRGAVRYTGGVAVRYNPLENCNPRGARQAFDRYRYWKDRGVPVRVVWDERQAGETVPDAFEFLVEGEDAREVDLVVCERNPDYLVSVTSLRAGKKAVRVRVQLKGEEMARWKVTPVFGAPVRAELSGGALVCRMELDPLASAVCLLTSRGGR